MKVLGDDLQEFASWSLQNTPSLNSARQIAYDSTGGGRGADGANHEGRDLLAGLGSMLSDMNFGERDGEGAFADARTGRRALTQLYNHDEFILQLFVFQILEYTLLSLRGPSTLQVSPNTSYENCATMYNAGFDNFPIFIYQHSNGEYLGTSNGEAISISHAFF